MGLISIHFGLWKPYDGNRMLQNSMNVSNTMHKDKKFDKKRLESEPQTDKKETETILRTKMKNEKKIGYSLGLHPAPVRTMYN